MWEAIEGAGCTVLCSDLLLRKPHSLRCSYYLKDSTMHECIAVDLQASTPLEGIYLDCLQSSTLSFKTSRRRPLWTVRYALKPWADRRTLCAHRVVRITLLSRARFVD